MTDSATTGAAMPDDSAESADNESGVSSEADESAETVQPAGAASDSGSGGDSVNTESRHKHRKPALHLRISTQMYAGIAVPLLLTLAASVIAWISFARVGEAEKDVTDGAIRTGRSAGRRRGEQPARRRRPSPDGLVS